MALCMRQLFLTLLFKFLLEKRHLTLYVLDNVQNQSKCYDSLSYSSDTRQKMIHKGRAFFDFFQNGKQNRYWTQTPIALRDKHCVSAKQVACVQQTDSSSFGVFCCLYAEEVSLRCKEIKDSKTDQLRKYITC